MSKEVRLFVLLAATALFWGARGSDHAAQSGDAYARTAGGFSVATWNIRAGYGANGFEPNQPFDMNTPNCTDATRPRNAWGVGFVQRFLDADIRADADAVALGLQEAWGECGNVRNITAFLGWAAASPNAGGVGLIARYGVVGPWDVWQIERRNVDGAPEDRWVVGGNICVARDCVRTVYMWTTHLAATRDADWPQHMQKALQRLPADAVPQIFMGDLNVWQNDQWSPATNCGTATPPMVGALAAIIEAGFTDAWAATQLGEGWTATVPRPGCGPARNGSPYKRIDYIWSKGLSAVATTRIGVVAPGAPAPADHLGVKARFAYPNPASDSRTDVACTTDASLVVAELYRRVLERPYDVGGQASVDKLARGEFTVRELVRALALSPEHVQRFQSPDSNATVATLYRHVLGREPDPDGLRVNVAVLERQNYAAVVDGLITSDEYETRLGDLGIPGSGLRFCGAQGAPRP